MGSDLKSWLAGTIPAKLLLQLTTAFREGGLCDRSGRFFYKDHLHKTNVPVLALAGDQDLICPPEAVYGTIQLDIVLISNCDRVDIHPFLVVMVEMDQKLLSSFLNT